MSPRSNTTLQRPLAYVVSLRSRSLSTGWPMRPVEVSLDVAMACVINGARVTVGHRWSCAHYCFVVWTLATHVIGRQ